MKVGLVCPYNLFHGGGVQECVFALQEELQKRGHQVKIITPLPRDYDGKLRNDVLFIGNATQVKSFHTTSQVSVSVSNEAVDNMLFEEQFDLLHFHEPWVPMVSMQILSRSNCINIATFHAKLPETVMHRTIERVITPYTKSIMKYLNGLTAVSEAAAEYVQNLTNKHIDIIPNGIDIDTYQNKMHTSRKTKNKKQKKILYVGRLEKRKGIPYLLRAYQELRVRRPEVSLVIAGDGPNRAKLEHWVDEYDVVGITFKGYVTLSEKIRLLQASDLFCSPAPYGESFGIVLLEAMASGLVTVAGDNSGYSAVLQGRGALSLVNPKDTSEFARRLELLLYDDALRTLWQDWAAQYVQQFNYPTVVDQYEALYERLLEES